MSITPIWDATLADAPANIWQASNIFPRPFRPTDSDAILDSLEASGVVKEDQFDALVSVQRIARGGFTGHPDYRDWTFIRSAK